MPRIGLVRHDAFGPGLDVLDAQDVGDLGHAVDDGKLDGGSLDGKNEVSCGMGVAEVAVSRPADYGYALESGMGSVTIDDYSHSGMGVELEVNRSAATFYDIECGMGEVTITFN